MKFHYPFFSVLLVLFSTTNLIASQGNILNVAVDIPIIEEKSDWEKVPNVAQYKEADWSNVFGKAENVTVSEAKSIASSHPEITYFFYVKGMRLVLENLSSDPGVWRVFHHGDAVFFTGEPWWGTAPKLADGYIKKQQ